MNDTRTLPELVDGIKVAMVTLSGPSGMEARPLTVQKVEADALWFLVGDEADWLPAADGPANAVFVDDKVWVSTTGNVSTTRDASVIQELNDAGSDAWFQEDQDPVALRLDVDHGDWWAVSSKIGAAAKVAIAKITGKEPDVGDRGELAT